MTWGEAKEIVGAYLRGDVKDYDLTPLYLRMALHEICTRCEPRFYIAPYREGAADVLRMLPADDPVYDESEERYYLKEPAVASIEEGEELPIDRGLAMAVVFFLCSYFSNKSKERYEKKAREVIDRFISNLPPA